MKFNNFRYLILWLLCSCAKEDLFYPKSPEGQYVFWLSEDDRLWTNRVAYAVLQSHNEEKVLVQRLLAIVSDTAVVVSGANGLIGHSELFKVELMSELGMVVAAIPMDSSKLGIQVKEALPYGILRGFNQQYQESMQVLLTDGFTEADFGYGGWGVSILERTDFTITASLITEEGIWVPVKGTIRITNEQGAILVEQKGLDTGFSKVGVPKGTMTMIQFIPDDPSLKVEKARLVLDQGQYLLLDYPIQRIHEHHDIIDIIFTNI